MKTIIKKTARKERLKEKKSATIFFVTDAGNLLRWRRDIDIWRIFNPLEIKWEEPPFDIGEVFNTLPISKEEAAKVMKQSVKLKHKYPYDEMK